MEYTCEIDDEMEKWEEALSQRRDGLKGEVTHNSTVKSEEAFIKVTFGEPKAKESKRTKEADVDLGKNKKKRNKNSLF